MTSILTNGSATSALDVLRRIGSDLGTQQDRISSGLRVETASDDVAYWSIYTTMKSDAKAMSAANDTIGISRGIVDTAYAAMETVRDSFVEIRNIAIMASQETAPEFKNVVIGGFVEDEYYAKSRVAELDRQMQQLQDQARAAINSASFAGVNLLHHSKGEDKKASETVHSFVVGYDNGKVRTMDVDAMELLLINDDFGSEPFPYALGYNPEQALFDSGETVLAPGSFTPAGVYWFNIPLTNSDGDPEGYDVNPSFVLMKLENNIVRDGGDRQGLYSAFANYIDEHLNALTDRMAYLGTIQNALEEHDELNKKMIDSVTKGVGILVDTDMEEASARLNALQAQQGLAVQSLQMANSQPQVLLQLFQ